ncbi:PIG-L deacetylase family protein [Pseudodesulfovibrio methanolicus]|uniref:PIG-L deacetylase family protein n=1 Tax=Pseudodesulfovibrio methanolicus TaxID=3126690 RepID=A0ABZ2IX22_9BACT
MLMLDRNAPVLVVAAHHDDEVLGCGGTMARLAEAGHPVVSAVLGQGAVCRESAMDASEREAVEAMMARQAAAAARVLGAKFVQTGMFPDNAFDSVPLLDIVRCVESVIERVRPQLILTHHGGDLNVDHRLTARAVQTAARPLPGSGVRTILAFEVLSSTEWTPVEEPGFRPDVFVDVAARLDRKIEAMGCYESELQAFPHPRSEGGIRHLAGFRGGSAGLAAAEGFALVRSVPVFGFSKAEEGV